MIWSHSDVHRTMILCWQRDVSATSGCTFFASRSVWLGFLFQIHVQEFVSATSGCTFSSISVKTDTFARLFLTVGEYYFQIAFFFLQKLLTNFWWLIFFVIKRVNPSFSVCIPCLPRCILNILKYVDAVLQCECRAIVFGGNFWGKIIRFQIQCWIVYDGGVDWVKGNGCVQCKTRNPQVHPCRCCDFMHLVSLLAHHCCND